MRVRINTIASGPDWSAQPGDVVELDDQVARDLLRHGFAAAVDPAPGPAPAPIETASKKPIAETREKKK